MKKIISTSPIVLFILYSLIPALYLFGLCAGLSLKLRFGEELMAVFGIYSLVVLMNLDSYPIERDKTNIFLATLLMPLAFISSYIVVGYCRSIVSIIFSAVWIICATQVFHVCVKKEEFWKVYKLASTMLGIAFAFYSLTMAVTARYGEQIKTYLSPNGTYAARVTSSSKHSKVDIIKTERSVELYIFYFEDVPQTINVEHQENKDSVEITFADENTLLIDGTSYQCK